MRIAFATTLGTQGSTIIGRVEPLATEFSRHHDVHVLLLERLNSLPPAKTNLTFHSVGEEPFQRRSAGKKRLRGFRLVLVLLGSAFRTAWKLHVLKPDRVIIVKTLPHNVLGVWLWYCFNQHKKIILDVDDFELTANVLTSLWQRFSIHWAERTAVKMASMIVTATPFLYDRFKHLGSTGKQHALILTGLHSNVFEILPPLSSPPSIPTLLYIGSLSISSGHRVDILPDILERVHRTHTDIHLIIAGSGDDEAHLRAEFEKRKLSALITWHGRFKTTDIPLLLSQASIVLDPIDSSIAQRAKSSFRVLLSVASGWPVVTSNVSFRPDVIPLSWHTSVFAEPGKGDSYAEKIKDILNRYPSVQERQTLKQEAHKWSWTVLAEQYEKLL